VIEENGSQTALITARMRAIHQLYDDKPLILNDPIAVTLLGPKAESDLKATLSFHQGTALTALRRHVVLRARYCEDRLSQAITRGIAQYIIVGAGYDTFAFRQPPWARDLTIIEIDHPATQQAKQSLLRSAGLPTPDNLQFVGIDLEQETLLDGLLRAGINTTVPSYFSWLGVTMYLTSEAINRTLMAFASFPANSEVTLTYAPAPDSTLLQSEVATEIRNRLSARTGTERFLSYFEPDKMESKLRTCGFSQVETLTSEAAHNLYLADKPYLNKSHRPTGRATGIVSALV